MQTELWKRELQRVATTTREETIRSGGFKREAKFRPLTVFLRSFSTRRSENSILKPLQLLQQQIGDSSFISKKQPFSPIQLATLIYSSRGKQWCNQIKERLSIHWVTRKEEHFTALLTVNKSKILRFRSYLYKFTFVRQALYIDLFVSSRRRQQAIKRTNRPEETRVTASEVNFFNNNNKSKSCCPQRRP